MEAILKDQLNTELGNAAILPADSQTERVEEEVADITETSDAAAVHTCIEPSIDPLFAIKLNELKVALNFKSIKRSRLLK